MKQIILALAVVMLAAPAWANVAITVEPLGDGKAAIKYDGTERVRAFALDITIDVGTIDDVTGFEDGRGDNNNRYGIFPANFSRYITVDPLTGEVSDWSSAAYTPVADAGDPGALGGLGTEGITIEMGSLYDTKAPPLAGTLCIITCSNPCKVTVTTNATRGNVVLENASEAIVDLTGATNIAIDGGATGDYTGPQPEQWEEVGKPDCWIARINPRQCHGDADGTSQGKQSFWVSTTDLDVLIAAWNKTFPEIDGKTADTVPLICADFDHLAQGKSKFRVSTNDLDILIANWQLAGKPTPDCP